MAERGAAEAEVRVAIEQGESEPARKGRLLYRKNFAFASEWRGRSYRQIIPGEADCSGGRGRR